MFCRQCEQTAGGTGCTQKGVCGKENEVAILQDLLIYSLKSFAIYGKLSRELGIKNDEADHFIAEGLFTTITNVDFDSDRIITYIKKAYEMKEKLKNFFLEEYKNKNKKDYAGKLSDIAGWKAADSKEDLLGQGEAVGIKADTGEDSDIKSLKEMLLYGLKGMAAYYDHAFILGFKNEEVSAFFYKGLEALTNNKLTANDLIDLIMEFGQANLKCMETLDSAHTSTFGNPVPTKVSLGVKKGPAIIVSGHDLHDLKQLLEQTENSGVNVYTHGEMLPAHGYPKLKKFKNLIGHYGTAWQNQQKEFDNIPAAILMTTNCIQKPKDSYRDRIFTTGLVAWPGLAHINSKNYKKDFSVLINKAKSLGGFEKDEIKKEIVVGFAHDTVLKLSGEIVEAVKTGKIKHFFLIGGCDGAKPGRNYYTEFAQKVPKDCIILTLACGKFRFNDLDFGYIGNFPRLLDCGQCNDAYSAIVIAKALAETFSCSVNELPLSLVLSWYEQKAVCILLTLLSLGIKNIRLGPSLPAFISSNVFKVLVDKFNIQPTTTAEADLANILG